MTKKTAKNYRRIICELRQKAAQVADDAQKRKARRLKQKAAEIDRSIAKIEEQINRQWRLFAKLDAWLTRQRDKLRQLAVLIAATVSKETKKWRRLYELAFTRALGEQPRNVFFAVSRILYPFSYSWGL